LRVCTSKASKASKASDCPHVRVSICAFVLVKQAKRELPDEDHGSFRGYIRRRYAKHRYANTAQVCKEGAGMQTDSYLTRTTALSGGTQGAGMGAALSCDKSLKTRVRSAAGERRPVASHTDASCRQCQYLYCCTSKERKAGYQQKRRNARPESSWARPTAQCPAATVSLRQRTPAYVSIRPHRVRLVKRG